MSEGKQEAREKWNDPALQKIADERDARFRRADVYAKVLATLEAERVEWDHIESAEQAIRRAIEIVSKLRDEEGLPQEKAQPESQPTISDMGVGDVAYGIAVRAIEGKWDAAKLGPYMARFAMDYAAEQRQAMAEKAAQHSWFYYSVEKGEWVCGGCQTGLGDYTKSGEQRRKLIETHIRSLASAEPPQRVGDGSAMPSASVQVGLDTRRNNAVTAEPPQGEAEKEGQG